MKGLAQSAIVAVIGAGTMGAGVAKEAVAAGHCYGDRTRITICNLIPIVASYVIARPILCYSGVIN
jgi:hypothetical protein